MPESKGRSKATFTPPTRAQAAEKGPNARWFVPVMIGLMVVGLLWVVTFYVTQQRFPIESIGRWNLGVGFGLMLAGFMMTTRWR